MSAFLVISANFVFFEKVVEIYPLNIANIGFLLSLGVFLFALIALLSLLLSIVLPVRLVCSFFVLLAAITGYFLSHLGIIIDADMIRNVVQTNAAEALDVVSFRLLLYVLLLGVVPVAIIWTIPLQKPASWYRNLFYDIRAAAVLLVLMGLLVLPLSDHYASFFREHKTVRSYTVPVFPVYSLGKYARQVIKSASLSHFIPLAHSVEHHSGSSKRKLVIMVVGETVRSDHMSLNGYHRNTNPALSTLPGVISFKDISACGTSTAVSVPCMFAYAGHDGFDPDATENTENVLDILKRAGINVLWRDNNSDSKGVALRVDYQDYKSSAANSICDPECRDSGMLVGLQQYIDGHPGDVLIVLHQMGSHGPAYYKRYPQSFETFRPACQSAELSECSEQEIINAYDNSILYTDYFLSKVIELLKQNTNKYQTTMLYVSDHGESLGESGIYLHGLPYLIAPEAQTKVPLVVWTSDTSDIDYIKSQQLQALPHSHDVLFPTLLQLFDVFTDLHFEENQPLLITKA